MLRARNLIIGIAVVVAFIATALLIAQDQETLKVRSPMAADDPRFPAYLSRLLGHSLTSGDRYTVHANELAFEAMLAAIDGAQHRVSFETYVFRDTGETPERFVSAFEAAARRGVEVRLVLDGFAATLTREQLRRLEDAGCTIGWFNRIGGFDLEEANYRTHRKSLIVDGDVAFVGGTGIDDQWARDSEKEKRWRDMMVEVRGPAAINVEAAFNENWIETVGLVEPDLLEHADAGGSARSIVVWSSSEGGTNALKLLYLLAIASAQRSLDIQSPYLLTDESTRWSLAEARRRGVKVRMLMEGDVTDTKPVKYASREEYGLFMRQGIEVYEYQPAMMHAKAMMVDGFLSIFGSANFDNRSLELNDELNIAVFDEALATRLTQDFEQDLENSMRLELDSWESRPLHIRGREKLWSFFGEVF